MAFYNKVETLFASEKELAALPDETREEKLRTTRSRILALNDQRVIAAHCSYDAVNNGTAVQFRRVVAKGELKISDIVWTEGDVERKCAHVMELVGAVGALVAEMKPFELMADASDPRNVAVLYMAGII